MESYQHPYAEQQRDSAAYPSRERYDSPYGKEYAYQEVIPAKNKVDLQFPFATTLSQSFSQIFVNFILRTSSVALLIYAFVVAFLAIPATAKYFGCSYTQLEFPTQDQDCGSHAAKFFGVIRIAYCMMALPVAVYNLSGAGRAAIGFTMVQEMAKWRNTARFFGKYLRMGNFNIITFFVFAFAAPGLQFDDLSHEKSNIKFAPFLTSPNVFFVSVICYTICQVIAKKACIAEFDYHPLPEEVEKGHQEPKPIVKAMNIIIALIFFLLLCTFLTAGITMLATQMNIRNPIQNIIRYAFIAILLMKYAFLIRHITKQTEKVQTCYNVYCFEIFFLICLFLEVWDYETDIFQSFLITYYVLFGILAVLVFIYNIFLFEEIKVFFHNLLNTGKYVLLEGEGLVPIVTITSSLTAAVPLIEVIASLSGGANQTTESPYDFKICSALSNNEEVKKLLSQFTPSQNLLHFSRVADSAINFEMKIFGLFIIIAVLFLFRFVGSIALYRKLLAIAILYQIACILRMDGINDVLRGSRNFGFVQMTAHTSAIAVSEENLIILMGFLLLLVAAAMTPHNRENKLKNTEEKLVNEVNQSEDTIIENVTRGNAEVKATPKTFYCTRLFTYIALLLIIFLLICSAKEPWMRMHPAKPDFYRKDYAAGDMDTQEIVGGKYCTLKEPDATIVEYSQAVATLSAGQNILYEDERVLAPMVQLPFSSLNDKIGFFTPTFLTIALILMGGLFPQTMRKQLNEILSALLITMSIFNFVVLIEAYFLTYSAAMQQPAMFVDVKVENGFYFMMATIAYGILILAMHFVDTVANTATPTAYKAD